MSEISEAQDFVLDCYNVIKTLSRLDPSIWEPVRIVNGKKISVIDGREMSETEFLKKHPPGTFT